jgi:hypothetical protein
MNAAEIEEEFAEYIQHAGDPFSYDSIFGASDGDYPPWISLMNRGLPEGFAEKHGEWVDSFLNGSWVEFPCNRAAQLAESLRTLGFDVQLQMPGDPRSQFATSNR